MIGAGPAMNMLIAFVIFFVLAFGVKEVTGPGSRSPSSTDESPAAGQLQAGDRIVSVDGKSRENLDGDERADAFPRADRLTHLRR